MNRIERIKDKIIGMTDPEDQMMEIMSALNGTVTPVPDPGGYYTFVYNAKTPGIIYDPYPLVGVERVFDWGFIGINLHWEDRRQYTWDQIISPVYEIQEEERVDMERLSYGDFSQSPSK